MKRRLRKEYRDTAAWTMNQLLLANNYSKKEARFTIHYDFYLKTQRAADAADDDNHIAWMKGGQDGIAIALFGSVKDELIRRPTVDFHVDKQKQRVEVTVTPTP